MALFRSQTRGHMIKLMTYTLINVTCIDKWCMFVCIDRKCFLETLRKYLYFSVEKKNIINLYKILRKLLTGNTPPDNAFPNISISGLTSS